MSERAEIVARRINGRTRWLTRIACAGMMISLVAQLLLQRDWHGLPFLVFAVVLTVIIAWRFIAIWRLADQIKKMESKTR